MTRLPIPSTGWLLLLVLVASPLPAEAGGVRFVEAETTTDVRGTSVAVTSDGKHVYVAGQHDNTISVLATDSLGDMTEIQSLQRPEYQ